MSEGAARLERLEGVVAIRLKWTMFAPPFLFSAPSLPIPNPVIPAKAGIQRPAKPAI